MVTVTIRHVPDETRDVLAARARREARSVQEHLRHLRVDAAERRSTGELFDEVRVDPQRYGGTEPTAAQIVQPVHEAREDR